MHSADDISLRIQALIKQLAGWCLQHQWQSHWMTHATTLNQLIPPSQKNSSMLLRENSATTEQPMVSGFRERPSNLRCLFFWSVQNGPWLLLRNGISIAEAGLEQCFPGVFLHILIEGKRFFLTLKLQKFAFSKVHPVMQCPIVPKPAQNLPLLGFSLNLFGADYHIS